MHTAYRAQVQVIFQKLSQLFVYYKRIWVFLTNLYQIYLNNLFPFSSLQCRQSLTIWIWDPHVQLLSHRKPTYTFCVISGIRYSMDSILTVFSKPRTQYYPASDIYEQVPYVPRASSLQQFWDTPLKGHPCPELASVPSAHITGAPRPHPPISMSLLPQNPPYLTHTHSWEVAIAVAITLHGVGPEKPSNFSRITQQLGPELRPEPWIPYS